MAVDILRTESNERVDLGDFDFVSQAIQNHERQMVDNFLCDPGRLRQWILSGFSMDNPAGKQLRVTKGKAILAQRISGAVQYGVLTTEGDADLTVDLNSYAAGAYGIYIRFDQVAGENQSRIFWDPSGVGSEYAQAVNTRLTAAWSLRIESTTPGADWIMIGVVEQATMAITDKREFYFEGAVANLYESGWSSEGGGAANDRNANRATYGVTDLQMFSAAMRQCVEDIKGRGLKKWWDRDIGGMNIGFDANPVSGRLAVGDANYYLGLSGGNPRTAWETGAYAEYNRTGNDWSVTIGGSEVFKVDETDGVFFHGDANFVALISGTNPRITFAANDYLEYNRTGNAFEFYVGSDLSLTVLDDKIEIGDADFGMELAGPDPHIWFDEANNDYFLYTRLANQLTLYIGGSQITKWDSAGAAIAKGLFVGDITGVPDEDTIHIYDEDFRLTADADEAWIYFTDVDYIKVWRDTHSLLLYLNGSDYMNISSSSWNPGSGGVGTLNLGNATYYFADVYCETLKPRLTDSTGEANFATITGYIGDAGDGAVGSVANAGGHASTKWLKIYIGTTPYWIPLWDDITT